MELPGGAYLLNLSLLAITFAAVSVLVMLVRWSMGGKLSNFDIHLGNLIRRSRFLSSPWPLSFRRCLRVLYC